MSLMRWEPFEEIERTMNRMLGSNAWRLPRLPEGSAEYQWQPAADIIESEKEYLVRAELPGVKKDDVKISLENDILTISGERRIEKDEKAGKVHRLESFHGTFTRRFSLPDDVDAAQIRAESRDGVLTIHLPRKPSTPANPPVDIKVS